MVTGTRAEFGLLRWVIDGILKSKNLELQLVPTGMHLSPEFGHTVDEIMSFDIPVTTKVEMLVSSDSPVGVAKSIGLGVIGFADAISSLRPDVLLILGDRFESMAAAIAGLIAGTPICHIHGGEVSEGAVDEAIRHSITKMSSLHFVAAEQYRQRVIQLGEPAESVFLVGGLGVDNLKRCTLMSKEELEADLGFNFLDKNLLISFHPETLGSENSAAQAEAILAALSQLTQTRLIFTAPNADVKGHSIRTLIETFVINNKNAHLFTSLGTIRYLSCLTHVDAVIGNSSSGLLEAPSIPTACINVGTRQKGRLRAKSVIDCLANVDDLNAAIEYVYSDDFKAILNGVTNPYGNGGASDRIVDLLEKLDIPKYKHKSFNDLNFD